MPPPIPTVPLVVEPEAPQAGWWARGGQQAQGIYEPERYRWLRENFAPVDHVGYSCLLFHISPEHLQEVVGR